MAADRAINMALRVLGIGEVERDFARVGRAGEQSFEKVEKAANGADRQVSAYTERLRRAAEAARRAFDSTPGVAEGRLSDPEGYITARNSTILQRVQIEKDRIQQGLPDLTEDFLGLGSGVGSAEGALARFALTGATIGSLLIGLKQFVLASAEAFIEHERALDAFEATLSLSGNRVEVTTAQIADMADEIVRSTLQSEEAALQGAAALARVRGQTVENFEAMLEASARYADAIGAELPQVLESVTIPVLQALADRDMKALLDATEELNPALRANILQLAELGRTADAQRALIEGLTAAAGDGPDGLTSSTNELADAWDRLKVSFAESGAEEAAAGINFLADVVGALGLVIDGTAAKWSTLLASPLVPFLVSEQIRNGPDPGPTGFGRAAAVDRRGPEGGRKSWLDDEADAIIADFERRYGGNDSARRGRARSDNSAERLQAAAERARAAAARVAESNDGVVESYARRAREAEETLGLEGAALAAVERRHALDAAVRRLNREEIEREVEARRAEAAAAGEAFDEVAATEAATAVLAEKAAQLRELAERELEAAEATALFNRRQVEAAALIQNLRSPLDVLNDEVEHAIELLRAGALSADDFDRRMDQLAEGFADAAYAADESAQAWAGFGDEVGKTLSDIALNGGDAIDILRELVRLPLRRLLDQQIANPVADWIDNLTGNNRAAGIADARGGLPDAQQVLGASVRVVDPAAQQAALSLGQVGTSGLAAAQGLQAVAFAGGNPIEDLALQSDRASAAMGELVPVTGRFGGVLAQAIAQLSGGAGGGGLLGAALQFGLGAISGGSGGFSAGLMASVNDNIAANPGLFASGTDRLPTGKPFWVGENGRELMEQDAAGNLRVYSNQQAHRMASAGGGMTVVNNISVPARADPRHTASSVSRGTQQGLARSAQRGLAAPAGRR